MWVPPLPIERSAEFGVDLGRKPSMCFSHCPAFKNRKAKAFILEVNESCEIPASGGPPPGSLASSSCVGPQRVERRPLPYLTGMWEAPSVQPTESHLSR